jgi:hypothetical protein
LRGVIELIAVEAFWAPLPAFAQCQKLAYVYFEEQPGRRFRLFIQDALARTTRISALIFGRFS